MFVQVLHHRQRQADLLRLCFCLLPAVVEIFERFWVNLFLVSLVLQRKKEVLKATDTRTLRITHRRQQVAPAPKSAWTGTTWETALLTQFPQVCRGARDLG